MPTNEVYQNETVDFDDADWVNCKFHNCRMVYSGGRLGLFEECAFRDGTSFHLKGAAENTLIFLTGIYHASGIEGKAVVEGLFEQIRKGGGSSQEEA